MIKAEEENPKEKVQEPETTRAGIFGSESKNIGKIEIREMKNAH